MPTKTTVRSKWSIKTAMRAFRHALIAEQTMDHLQAIREHELEVVVGLLPPGAKLLEIGAGTGWQASALAQRGFDVTAIDLPDSKYADGRTYPVINYDGHQLPFGEGDFTVVYSSNLLEHIPDLAAFQREIHRVLRPGGCVIHVLPSSSWRFWTNLTHIFVYGRWPQAHGEHSANAFDELFRFSRREWLRSFFETGWVVQAIYANRLFYTGNSICDARLSIASRRILSYLLGSSCNVFVLQTRP